MLSLVWGSGNGKMIAQEHVNRCASYCAQDPWHMPLSFHSSICVFTCLSRVSPHPGWAQEPRHCRQEAPCDCREKDALCPVANHFPLPSQWWGAGGGEQDHRGPHEALNVEPDRPCWWHLSSYLLDVSALPQQKARNNPPPHLTHQPCKWRFCQPHAFGQSSVCK